MRSALLVKSLRLLSASLVTWLAAAAALPGEVPWQSGLDLVAVFESSVARRLSLPADEQTAYAKRLEAAFAQAGIALDRAQYVLLVDRSPRVQAALIYWRDAGGAWHHIGTAPASTGKRGGFEYFLTPLGVFEHRIDNLDFRAEGTRNKFGVLGYGNKGMRVFDFGWVQGERTWDGGGKSLMRLQVHATDPGLLEPRLGEAASKGCIRIPADFNRLLDRYGLLDADYEAALARGTSFWVLRPERTPTPWSGRYLVIVDSERAQRPAWAKPLPVRSTTGAKVDRAPRC